MYPNNPISRMDSAIIGFVEKFAHWFQRLTGKTNFFLAGFIAGALLIPVFVGVIRGVSPLNPLGPEPSEQTGFGHLAAFGLICLLAYTAFFGWKKKENEAWERLSKGVANPRKGSLGWLCCRIWCLQIFGISFLILLIEASLLGAAMTICLALYLYLETCDPLPPCQGKIKEWLGSLFAKRATEPG